MIYFLKANDRIKIGYSHDPSDRVPAIQTASPYRLEVLLILEGTRDREGELHKKFANYRCQGEWFEFCEPIQKFIEDNAHRDRKYECGFTPLDDFEGYEQIRSLRSRLNKSTTDVGELLGISRQAISDAERREKTGGVTTGFMMAIGEALGYEFQYRFIPKRNASEETSEAYTNTHPPGVDPEAPSEE